MNTIKWSGYEWMLQERWGQVHPEKAHWWYDSKMVEVDSNNVLHLRTGPSVKTFTDLGITSQIGAGLVSCTEEFSYGTFKINAKLPYGRNLWPAFWMWSWSDWPPEIDVMEAYSDKNPGHYSLDGRVTFWDRFFKRLKTYAIYPSFKTTKQDGSKQMVNTDSIVRFKTIKEPDRTFIEYKCIWAPDYIKIYYDNIIMFEIQASTSIHKKNLLDQLHGHKMNVIINNGVTSYVPLDYLPESDFMISNFEYTPL